MVINRPLIVCPHIILLSQGSRGDSESFTDWWIFPRLTDDDVSNAIDACDIYAYGGVPGNGFARRACVRHTSAYTVITQNGGLDI